MIAFDFETHLILPGRLAPRVVCASFCDASKKPFLLNREYGFEEIDSHLKAGSLLIGANVAYDFGCLVAAEPKLLPSVWSHYEKGLVYDIFIAATLNAIYDGRLKDGELFRIDGTRNTKGRYSLEECVLESLGRKDAKKNDEYRLRYGELDGTPINEWPEVARQYPLDDALNTFEVYERQQDYRNLLDVPFQAHAAFALHLSAIHGIRTDGKKVEAVKKEAESKMLELQRFAVEKGWGRLKNGKFTRSKKALEASVSAAYNGEPPKTETKAVATDRLTLTASGDRDLVKWGEYSKHEKVLGYVKHLEGAAKVPLNTRYNVLLASGRTSAEGIIQLIPSKGGLRECFVPREGFAFISVDYAAIEMSTLAQVCLDLVGWSELASVINSGLDPHCFLGAKMTGVEYDVFKKKAEKKDSPEYGVRQAAKGANFGFPGMMSAATFVLAKLQAGDSVCEWLHRDGHCGKHKSTIYKERLLERPLCRRCIDCAEQLKSEYVRVYREMRPYWKIVTSMLEGDGNRISQLRSPRIRGGLTGPQGANTLFQGLASEGAKRAVIAMTQEMYLGGSPLFGSRLSNFSHDETITEVPIGKIHEAGYRQAEIMVSRMREVVPDVLVKAEPAAMPFWSKKADTVLVDGRLTLWHP